ncbi:acyl-CoA Delta-9 desaturase-like [Osmia lignaria lignaria]|uniref:acyl-CoA Delta-9 desaturase-like n=1 Tax=Osmia lignaria lignaria TaxID=1437193 RepID=UPI00402B517A
MESEATKENETYEVEEVFHKESVGTDKNYKHEYLWTHIVAHSILQIGWLIGIYTTFVYAKAATILWAVFVGFLAGQGVGIGAHRGYSHKCFKSTLPLKVALLVCQTMAGQNSMFTWSRDHRVHHKYSDTDLDPHNANRGLFFSHIGWMMAKKHPLLRKKQMEIDVEDLLQDKLLMFQHKYFVYLYVLLAVIIPVGVPIYFWNESLWSSLFTVYFFPYVTNLHSTWSTNSFAHHFGRKPYDSRIRATDSPISSILTMGEGWHNFHHAFPWDYRMGRKFSLSASLLDLLAYLGLAYDLKIAAPNVIQGHMKRHGDKIGQQMVKEVIESTRLRKDANESIRSM